MGISRLVELLIALVLSVTFLCPLDVLAAVGSTYANCQRPAYVASVHTVQKRSPRVRSLVRPKLSSVVKAKSKVKSNTVKPHAAPKKAAKNISRNKKSKQSLSRSRSTHKSLKRKVAKTSKQKVVPKHLNTKRVTTLKKPKYAYPADIFLWTAPKTTLIPLAQAEKNRIKFAFNNGIGGAFAPQHLVACSVFKEEALLGGIFVRREPVRFIVLHSTETATPADAQRVVRSWNRGMRHPGAQYLVDRDGSIYQTVDPQYATVHVDIFRSIAGVNNDNSIGIELVRAGAQKYTCAQLQGLTKLVFYLQNRFSVDNSGIYGHGQIQPSDRSDPVGFNWTAFDESMSALKGTAVSLTATSAPAPSSGKGNRKSYDGLRMIDITGPASEDELIDAALDDSDERF